MCIFTHFAAGALAGGLTGNVYLGAVAGLASHAVLDVIPHYDHPDWRLEMGGGVASLLLLLMMPFVSWPAVVGGIFGMVPDLENLLQKLGKMRRDQFIYPTHTGLLPHGRALGPRSIVWQFVIFVGCFLLLSISAPTAVRAAGGEQPVMARPVVRVLATSPVQTVVRVDFPVAVSPPDWQAVDPMFVQWALPLFADDSHQADGETTRLSPPRLRLSLAVPTRQPVTWVTRDVRWWKEPADDNVGSLVDFSLPVVARSVPLTGSELPVAPYGGVLRSVTIDIRHPAHGRQREYLDLAAVAEKRADAAVVRDQVRDRTPAGILNPQLFAMLTMGGQEAARQAARRSRNKAGVIDLFGLTTHWVKLNLTETGLYRYTGQELSNLGVSTTAVDPTKLRLYRGGNLSLTQDPEFPDEQQLERIGLNEVAIEVRDGGDGEWNLDDEFRFYGVGTSAWLDRLDRTGGPLEFYDHPFAAEAVYWLSWEDDVTPSPLPGSPQRVVAATAAPTGGQQLTTAQVRLHREEQFLDSAGVVQDNWLWDNTIFSSRTENFSARSPAPDTSTLFQVDIRGIFGTSRSYIFDVSASLNGDEANAAVLSFTKTNQDTTVRMLLVGESSSLTAGTNLIKISNNSTTSPKRAVALDSYDIQYWANLVLTEGAGPLAFTLWGNEVTVPGTSVDLVVSPPSGSASLLWNVSDPDQPEVWNGASGAGNSVIYGLVRDPGVDQHFVAAIADDFLAPLRGLLVTPTGLRSRPTDVDYIVVTASAFTFAAQDLAAYRRTVLPGVAAPVTAVVSVDDIYDNFAGGQKDPLAIRNYLKWVYEQSAHRLQYVCLLGNASRDYRNYRGRTPLVDLYDLVSTELRTSFPSYPRPVSRQLAYSSDDGLVSFDTPPAAGDLDFPDLACGRLPALSVAEAQAMVERSIAYEVTPAEGLWRNNILLTADDVVRPIEPYFPGPYPGENAHTLEAEHVARDFVPVSIDVSKIYGVDYDFPPGSVVKPAARADINAHINSGTTIYYYVGHGAEDNLADEQIFQSRDIPNLGNGLKRPVFVAFSCDVGIFDSPSRRSMAEQFIQYEAGGAIGCICASQVSFTFNNDALTESFFGNLFPGRHVSAAVTVSQALRLAKGEMTITPSYRSNSQRYNFFGDPGLRLPHPIDDLTLAPTSVDTLRTGALQSVVLSGMGKIMLGAGDFYALRVEESAFPSRYVYNTALAETSFVAAGAPVFIGTGTMGGGDLFIPFKVPTQMRYGDRGRVRLLVDAPDGWHVAATLLPAVRAAIGPNDDVVGPVINLAFEDNLYRVRPGAELTAVLQDTSGVAILGTSPGNSLLLEFDNSGFMTDVTGSFGYDADSYTSGRLAFPLPRDLKEGRHLAALHASDVLGNVGSDTLSFEIGEAGQGTIGSVTLFPNPTAGYCRLLFELGDPMTVQWDIYSLAGSRLRSVRANLGAGPQVLEWDGRDGRNDEIANGTYLYVLRGLGATADDREIRKTGKLVIMR